MNVHHPKKNQMLDLVPITAIMGTKPRFRRNGVSGDELGVEMSEKSEVMAMRQVDAGHGSRPIKREAGAAGVKLTLSPTIQTEYENRGVFGGDGEWPLVEWNEKGCATVAVDVAQSILADAEYNSDKAAVEVGPYGTPLSVFNAYRALAKQVRRALAGVQS